MNFSPLSAVKRSSGRAFRACFPIFLFGGLMTGCGPNDGVKELEQAKAAYDVHDVKKAEKLFEKSLSLAPQDVDRLLYLARVKIDLGEMSAAKDLTDRAAALAGDACDVEMLASQIAWHAKDYKRAAEGFGRLAADASLDASVRSQAEAGLGIVEMTCNNIHLARISFLRAIRLDRRNAAAWYHLGLLYRDGFGYLEAALEQFDIYVRLEVEASPRVQKVQRTVIPGLKEAISHAATDRPGASKRDSSSCSTALAKADEAWKSGNYKTARQAYQDAVRADALSYPATLGLAKAWAKTDTTKDGLQKAFESYKAACMLSPSAVATFLATGALAMQLGYVSQAVEIYSRAVAANPSSIDAIDGLIRALRKVGGKAKEAQAYQLYREVVAARRK